MSIWYWFTISNFKRTFPVNYHSFRIVTAVPREGIHPAGAGAGSQRCREEGRTPAAGRDWPPVQTRGCPPLVPQVLRRFSSPTWPGKQPGATAGPSGLGRSRRAGATTAFGSGCRVVPTRQPGAGNLLARRHLCDGPPTAGGVGGISPGLVCSRRKMQGIFIWGFFPPLTVAFSHLPWKYS